jgi:hypothetical protein
MLSLVLHAGFHKTGTSAIQQFAARNRRRLKEGGVLYPAVWSMRARRVHGHHALAHALAKTDRDSEFGKVRRLLRRWREQAVASQCTALVSSEAICRYGWDAPGVAEGQGNPYLARWLELLSEFDVLPVLVIRRQDDFVRSLYQEHVAAGVGASARLAFSEFLTRAASEKPGFSSVWRASRKVFGQGQGAGL